MEETMPHIPTPLLSGSELCSGRIAELLPACVRKPEKSLKVRVEVKDTFFGSPVRAGNKIICVSAYGQVVIIEDGEAFKQLEYQPGDCLPLHSRPPMETFICEPPSSSFAYGVMPQPIRIKPSI